MKIIHDNGYNLAERELFRSQFIFYSYRFIFVLKNEYELKKITVVYSSISFKKKYMFII